MSLRPGQSGADLDARYGRRPARSRRTAVIVSAVALGVAAVVWLLWAQPWSTNAFWETTGYRIIDDRTIAVTWSATLAEGQPAHCAVAAQNPAHAIVGWKIVEIVGTDVPTQLLSEPVRTTEPAVTGLVYRCWLP